MSDHDPLCPMALSRRAKRCTCMELHKRDTRVRADEREKFCDCPAAFTRYKATHEAEVRERIELMLVSEGYEAAAFLVASMTPDGRADHRGGESDE